MLSPTCDIARWIAPAPVHFTPSTTTPSPTTIPAIRRTDFDRWFITMQTRHATRRSRDGAHQGGSEGRTRLLYLQPSSTFGGAERQASIVVPLLSKLGFDVTTMVGPSTSGIDWLRENGADDLIHTPNFPGGWPKPRGLGRLALPIR